MEHLMANMISEEKKMDAGGDTQSLSEIHNKELSLAERSSSNSKDGSYISEIIQLKSTKTEMGVVKEENERLKMVLAKILKDYQSLQMHFPDIVDKEAANKSTDTTPHLDEEDDLVSLSLGRHSSDQPRKNEKKTRDSNKKDYEQDEKFDAGLKLGLDCKFEPSQTDLVMNTSSKVSAEKQTEEVIVTETWPPCKSLKTKRSDDHGELLQATPLKRVRVSVRARCETPTMNDGCQWRKYGQKIAKGNPCPRAYYRCTVSPTCPVRKQVQRCADDMSILTTTYEGSHNHPLPVSATAMASTTSAAASMLQSNSSSSQHGISNTASLHGLSFTSSTLNSHPTITLDLTNNNNNSQYNYFNKPRYQYQPSTSCLNFSTPTSITSTSLPLFYNNNNNNNINNNVGRLMPQDNFYSYNGGYMQKGQISHSQQQMMFSESAATKTAITSNSMLRSALETALATLVSNNGGGGGGGDANKSSHNMKWSY